MTQKHSEILEHMEREDFLRTVRRAMRDSDEANESRRTLVLWSERLAPYLDASPHMTIAEAIDRYNAEHA
jgi:hypothetical protein